MTPKQVLLKIKGMQRDLSDSSFRNDYAYENKNIRITADSDNGLLSVTTEKSTKEFIVSEGCGNLVFNKIYFEGNTVKSVYPVASDIRIVTYVVGGTPNEVTIPKGETWVWSYNGNPITNISVLTTTDDTYYYGQSLPNYSLGNIIGTAEIDNKVVIFHFREDSYESCISLLSLENCEEGQFIKATPLYKGSIGRNDLNFSTAHPIETLVDIENENVQKVYWVDGINQPRVINIKGEIDPNDPKQFDFVQEINGGNISVEQAETSGQFPAGVIQYAFTYFNKYGAESAVVDVSPIYYIANSNKGAEPNEIVSKSFKITLNNLDNDWDYCRIYSIIRTSLNATPEVRKVVDLKLNEVSTFIDTGSSGEYIAPTDLLYKGGEVLAASTITSKAGTLFLGDLEIKNNNVVNASIKKAVKNAVANKHISFEFTNEIRPSYNLGPLPKTEHRTGDFNSTDSSGQFYSYINHLNESNNWITTFKLGEFYRIGIQLQNIFGKWSDPIYIGDYKNNLSNGSFSLGTDDYNDYCLVTGRLDITDKTLLTEVKNAGYIKIRPVIVYPEGNDRSIICQGVLCPTVFNVKDRLENGPYAQSSWFVRPNNPTSLVKEFTGEVEKDQTDNDYFKESGVWAESMHWECLATYYANVDGKWPFINNAEIPGFEYTDLSNVDLNHVNHKNLYFVDQNIVTFHSPDIEFSDNITDPILSNCKLKIVGYVPITSSKSDYTIQGSPSSGLWYEKNSTTKYITVSGPGKLNVNIKNYNKSRYAFRHLVNANLWGDIFYEKPSTNIWAVQDFRVYTVYPWNFKNHQIISESGYGSNYILENVRYYNYLFSDHSEYFNTPIISDGYDDLPIISKLCDTTKPTCVLGEKIYYGNIDKIEDVTINKRYSLALKNDPERPESEGSVDKTIFNDYVLKTPEVTNISPNFLRPIPITYNSTKHVAIALPSGKSSGEVSYEYILYGHANAASIFWDNHYTRFTSPIIKDHLRNDLYPEYDDYIKSSYGFLLLGELYKDINEETLFGGTSDYTIQNNLWVPCGKAVDISDGGISLSYTEGDTYYQRYDHIKTLPRNDQDLNGVTSVISFMCETRINLDGKYSERELYMENPDLITEEKFNQINTVYSQQNNFFNYRILDSERYGFNNLPNTIAWTKTKHANAITDEWLNINLASSIDLDGGKGKVTALKKFNDNIVAFQNKGISTVLFNSRVQITPSDNIPIEIANSGKVDGYRYISDKVGCFNKYSICESPNGIYFIDDYNKSLYAFNGELNNISDSKGFHSFMRNNCKLSIWNPTDFNNVVAYRDPINSEIMFIYNDKCLVYNETLGEFSSFYSYDKVPFVFTLNDNVILAKDGKLHIKNGGDTYGEFFGKTEDSYVEHIVNDNPTYDKIFSTLDMRADVLDPNNKLLLSSENTLIPPFNYLKVSNEYQEAISNLEGKEFIPKFRTWRAQFPRVGKDRIRNNWIRLKIGNINRTNFNHKVRLHDVVVNYFI